MYSALDFLVARTTSCFQVIRSIMNFERYWSLKAFVQRSILLNWPRFIDYHKTKWFTCSRKNLCWIRGNWIASIRFHRCSYSSINVENNQFFIKELPFHFLILYLASSPSIAECKISMLGGKNFGFPTVVLATGDIS